ncbi:MAG: hypothetical protein ACHQ50_17305 [Fimbriimonadales bacterium]
MSITVDSFFATLRNLAASETTLYTLKQARPFKVRWNGKKWVFVPQRTMGERWTDETKAGEVIKHFHKTGSLRYTDYKGITENGSYYCAVFDHM